MTDRLHRERTLPEGYQFGDAGRPGLRAEPVGKTGIAIRFVQQWDITPDPPRPLFLSQLQAAGHWNVIEGEDH